MPLVARAPVVYHGAQVQGVHLQPGAVLHPICSGNATLNEPISVLTHYDHLRRLLKPLLQHLSRRFSPVLRPFELGDPEAVLYDAHETPGPVTWSAKSPSEHRAAAVVAYSRYFVLV